jgi:hypothetical protein
LPAVPAARTQRARSSPPMLPLPLLLWISFLDQLHLQPT